MTYIISLLCARDMENNNNPKCYTELVVTMHHFVYFTWKAIYNLHLNTSAALPLVVHGCLTTETLLDCFLPGPEWETFLNLDKSCSRIIISLALHKSMLHDPFTSESRDVFRVGKFQNKGFYIPLAVMKQGFFHSRIFALQNFWKSDELKKSFV